jgi:hypothetical protein
MMRALRQHIGGLEDERRELLGRIRQLEETIEVLYGHVYVKPLEPPYGTRMAGADRADPIVS